MAVDDPDTNLKAETHFMIQSCYPPRIKAMRYHSITASCFALAAISAAMGQQFADVNQKEEIKPIAPPTDASLIDAKYRNASLPIEERIDDLLPRLNMEEKAELLHGASTFTYGRIPRIGLAEFGMFDGPQGVRLEEGKPSTALPLRHRHGRHMEQGTRPTRREGAGRRNKGGPRPRHPGAGNQYDAHAAGSTLL